MLTRCHARTLPNAGLGGALFRSCQREFECFPGQLKSACRTVTVVVGVVGAEFGRDLEKAEEVTDFGFVEKIGYADWAGHSGVREVGLG